MSEDEPAVTLEFLTARLVEVEEQAARQATWTFVGLLVVLGLAVLAAGVAELAAAQTQARTAALLRTCAVGAARMPEGRVTYCEQALGGFRLARAAVAADAVTVDSLAEWAQAGADRPWVPPTTTTLYPEPPE